MSGMDAGCEAAAARQRVVLLGASNLTRGLSTVVETARRIWGGPLEVLAALGHGRSYGRPSKVVCRELCGITECGLWRALDALPRARTAALITDIGNDLLYGASVAMIADWVEACLDRLAAREARTVITLLPVDNLVTLPTWRYLLVRNITFPKCRLSLSEIGELARELNDRVRGLAAARSIPCVEQRTAWYGFDPIHIKLSAWPSAWREILSPWCDTQPLPPAARTALVHGMYLHLLLPEERRLFGYEQHGKQPAARLADGTTISIY